MNKEKIISKIIEKWPVKVLSVAAALVITVFYRMNSLETRFVTVPLVIESSGHLIPVSSFAENVRVSLRGEASSIIQIHENDIEAYIDLDRYKNEGTFRIPVQIRKSGNALAVDPLEITVYPMEIQVVLEQKIIKEIPVHPVFEGKIALGFEMTNQEITPQFITAEGPKSAMERIEFSTNTIDLEGRYEDFSVLIPVINNNPLIFIHGGTMITYSASISVIRRGFSFPEPPVIPEIPAAVEEEDDDEEELE